MDKSNEDFDLIDLSVPRRAQHLHNKWKRYQDAVYRVDINVAIKKRLTICQFRSNAIILQGTLPDYRIPKVVRMKIRDVFYTKRYTCHFDFRHRSH